MYELEKHYILKTTPLTCSSVYPSHLQLQNVKHVVNVFNDNVVSSLKLNGKEETAKFIAQVLTWWKAMNVYGKNEELRFNDSDRMVQTPSSTNLCSFAELFCAAKSGHGSSRMNCLTHDTKKALAQTSEGLVAICQYLFTKGFKYVCLREIQSDRIESKFGVYRQSTGCNLFMTAGDVLACFKKRLAKFSAEFLENVQIDNHHISAKEFHFLLQNQSKIPVIIFQLLKSTLLLISPGG